MPAHDITTESSGKVDNMFQKKIDKLFNDISNVFCTADDITSAGIDADGRDHDVRLQ